MSSCFASQANDDTASLTISQDREINQEITRNALAKDGGFTEEVPRFYQDDLHKIALRENIIVFLGTGLGKTFISVLYLKAPQVAREIQRGRKLVFLAPSRDLLKQQAEYIKEKVSYRVKVYCGGRVDMCNGDSWRKEMMNVDILFMMPDIFVFAISTNLLDWREFVALVIDECHHAYNSKDKGLNSGDGSAYRSILLHYRDYYSHRPRSLYPKPRLIGLTASLINSMPKNGDSVADMVDQLERLFQGKCVTDIRVQESRPTIITHGYTPVVGSVANDPLKRILFNLREDIVCALKKVPAVQHSARNPNDKIQSRCAQPGHGEELGMSIKLENFPKIVDHLILIRDRCGIWALTSMCSRLIQALEAQLVRIRDEATSSSYRRVYFAFTEMIKVVWQNLHNFTSGLNAEQALLAHSAAKPMCLLDILYREHENSRTKSNKKSTFSCVVFVKGRLEVVAVHMWLERVSQLLPKYKFIKCGHALGLVAASTTTKCTIPKRKSSDQTLMLNDLRTGKLNVVVTTAVLEEGIDLPDCSTVIRYDLPDNFREYVQSRGRARQQVSTFVVMCEESERTKVEGRLRILDDLEHRLKQFISKRGESRAQVEQPTRVTNAKGSTGEEAHLETVDIYYARNNAVRIGPKVASQILNRYGQSSRSGFKYETGEMKPGVFRTTITMPPGCSLKGAVEGRPKTSKSNAENSAEIAVLRALIKARELHDNGTPYSVLGASSLEEVITNQIKGTHEADDDVGQSGRLAQPRCPTSGQSGGSLGCRDDRQPNVHCDPTDRHPLKFLRESSQMVQPKLSPSGNVNLFSQLEDLRTRLEEIKLKSL